METRDQKFYAGGLRFSCTRCSDCCRHEAGFVFLSQADLRLLAEGLQKEYTEIMESYCRWVPTLVPALGGSEQLSLKEKSNFDCIFWQDGCTVYQSRPLQCRTFPFWESVLCSPHIWEGLSCPGTGHGQLHSREYIESCLAQRRAEPILVRNT
ncbi:zinc/iron-chelating domain-containing protein [Spirochaetia bacterium]|nr:zinc/iron-chelating domain-containing protein [Spirochaetia bacterium]